MSVQLCISIVTLQQQSSQKMYGGLDKLYQFLFLYCYISPAAIHGLVLSVPLLFSVPSSPPQFTFSILWRAEIIILVPISPGTGWSPAVAIWLLLILCGRLVQWWMQQNKTSKWCHCPSVFRCLLFLFPTVLLSCLAAASFLNLSAPFSHSNYSSVCLSLPFSFYSPFNHVFFDIFAATAPFWAGVCVDIQKYLVGRGVQGQHTGEEFKFSYQRFLVFFWLLLVYFLKQDVLGFCLEISFWQIQILPLTFLSLKYLLFFSQPATSLLKGSISLHLPVISRSGLSKVINELCWPLPASRAPFHHASMQVSHISHTSVRAWPKELLLPLLLFVGVSGSGGMLLTWILTAALLPAGLQVAWVLTALTTHLFCSFFLSAPWHSCCTGCLKDPT